MRGDISLQVYCYISDQFYAIPDSILLASFFEAFGKFVIGGKISGYDESHDELFSFGVGNRRMMQNSSLLGKYSNVAWEGGDWKREYCE